MNPDYIIGTRNPGVIYATDRDGTAASYAAGPQTGGKAPEAAKHELSFDDILGILNPLQHIPVVSQIYRALSGDEISSFAKVAGDALFGGPIGFVVGIVNAIFEDETGKSAGETMLASLLGGETHEEMAASATPSPVREGGTLETQIARASPGSEPQTLAAQLAAGMPANEPKTLFAQLEAAQAPTSSKEEAHAMQIARAASGSIPLLAAAPHPPAVTPGGSKFYSLADVRRTSETPTAMPVYDGPGVRLKTTAAAARAALGRISPPEAEARRALGLDLPQAPALAALGPDSPARILGPVDAGLPPGMGPQPVPAALIEDMMKKGLDKYQQGLQNGAFSPRPRLDVKG